MLERGPDALADDFGFVLGLRGRGAAGAGLALLSDFGHGLSPVRIGEQGRPKDFAVCGS